MLPRPSQRQVTDEPASALCNEDAVRLRNTLQARRKVRGLAYDGLLLRSAGPNQVADDYKACCDAYARWSRSGLPSRRRPARRFSCSRRPRTS